MKYSEYKDARSTWMGSIPSHWKLERAKWSFTLRNERGNAEPVLLAATQKYGMYPQDLIEGVVKVAEGTDVQQFRTVHKDDFVISLRSFQGGFERSDYEGVCSPAYQVFYANNRWDTNYLKFLFKNELFIDAMNALTVGIREGRNIKYEDFANSVLAIPPISEQRSIAAFLDSKIAHIDSVIAEAKASIEEYKAWKASIIYEAVTKGLDPNVEMKVSGIEWIGTMPATWQLIRLKFLMESIVDCPHETPEYSNDGAYYVIRTADQDVGYLRPDENMYRLNEAEYTKRIRRLPLNKDDIVYGREGERWGLACIVPESNKYCLGQRMMQFRCNSFLFLPEFARWALNSYGVYMQGTVDTIGSTSPHVNISTMRDYQIPIPPIAEQERIAKYITEQCDKIISLINEKEMLINDLEAYKKSLIFEVVTGKRRVC